MILYSISNKIKRVFFELVKRIINFNFFGILYMSNKFTIKNISCKVIWINFVYDFGDYWFWFEWCYDNGEFVRGLEMYNINECIYKSGILYDI